MNKLSIFIISIALFFIGILFFYQQESWIIFNIPQSMPIASLKKTTIQETPATLWVYKKDQWISETKNIIESNDTSKKLYNLVSSWFIFAEEEQIINQSISLNSIVLSPTGTLAFISLSNNPFNQTASTYETMMLVEGLLKTIRENKISIQSIQLLIQHKPMVDHRLNFSIPWPIIGYMQN